MKRYVALIALFSLALTMPVALAQYRVCNGPDCNVQPAGNGWQYHPQLGWFKFAEPTPAVQPAAKPVETAKVEAAEHLTGVDRSKLTGQGYQANGQDVPREIAYGAVANKTLKDVSGKPRITIIGDTEERKAALAALGNIDWAVVSAFPRDHWYPKAQGFKTDGHPTVYIQHSNGKVVHRQDDGAELGKAVGRANPAYDPAKDPDLRRPVAPAPEPVKPAPSDPAKPAEPSLDDAKKVGGGAVGAFLLMLLVRYGIPFAIEWVKNRKKPDATQEAILEALKKLAEAQAAKKE